MTQSLKATLSSLADRHPGLLGGLRRSALAVRRRLNAPRVQAVELAMDRMAYLIRGDICIHVDEFDGDFQIDARSALFRRLVRDGCYEPELTRLCRDKLDPNRDVLDIGANIGFHAVLFARMLQAGKVLSVEPTKNALARLQANVQRNGQQDKVLIHHGAVSDSAGSVDIKTIPGREEFSSIGNLKHPAVQGERFNIETVDTQTVDALVAHYQLNPGFMKVDVEGVEHLVFRGADKLLGEHRPIILAELSDPLLRSNGSSAQQVVDLIARFDYQIIDPLRPSVVPGTREFGDILCQPR